MFKRLWLPVCLLLGCAAESSVHGQPQEILAFAGGDVALPCRFSINPGADPPAVEWSKEGQEPNVVFLYRDGCETYEMKNEAFEYRTSLVFRDLHKGNASLKLLNVRMSDAGVYTCKILQRNAPYNATVKLVVAAVTEPQLSVVSPESGGVTLQCDTGCWLLEPQVTFQDDQGRDIPAENPKRELDGTCFTVRRRVALQRATARVTCRVHQPDHNQTREADIFIPADCVRSDCPTVCASVGGTVLLFTAVVGISYLVWRKYVKPANAKQPVTRQASDQTTISDDNENLLEQRVRTVTADTAAMSDTIQRLSKEVADLKSEIQKKDEIILKLQSNLRPQSVVCQHDQPTLDPSPSTVMTNNFPQSPTYQTNNSPAHQSHTASTSQSNDLKPALQRQNSNPPTGRLPNGSRPSEQPGSSSSHPAETKRCNITRSYSVSSSQPSQHSVTLPRRLSLSNRYSLLEALQED